MQKPFVTLAEIDASDAETTVLADLGANGLGLKPHDAFHAGHIPGAVFIDLDRWLAAPASTEEGRHPLPTPETFAEGMGLAGIDTESTVVAYDRVGGVFAARLVWMLRAVGVDAAVLDGGLTAFTDTGAALETGDSLHVPTVFSPRALPAELIADFDEVTAYAAAAQAGESSDVVLLDAREGARFDGEPHPLDRVSGHIPGATSLPCRENVDERGFLLPSDQLRAALATAGVGTDTPVISSCGSGVTACHTLLVLEHLGAPAGRLFPGSWSQWTSNGRSVAT